jgi:hypothetical protein
LPTSITEKTCFSYQSSSERAEYNVDVAITKSLEYSKIPATTRIFIKQNGDINAFVLVNLENIDATKAAIIHAKVLINVIGTLNLHLSQTYKLKFNLLFGTRRQNFFPDRIYGSVLPDQVRVTALKGSCVKRSLTQPLK